jgi:amino acid adenylation domain-containing protein
MNEYIHVMFEKSAWYFVAILAINKAGATWVPLDPSHPVERLKQVIGQTGARLCLSSEENIFLSTDIFAETLVVSPKLDEKLGQHGYDSTHGPVKHVSSSTAAYVLFTSGSTGLPKGLIMEHRSLCTSQSMVCKRLGLTSDVRMLQFAAFVFDFSIGEIGATLIAGACLCIPSEQDRMDNLAGFIEKMQVSWAFLTPSFARTLNPADVPSLKLLLLGGEAVDRDIFLTWYGKTRFINGWGPAETCCFGSMHEWKSPDESPMTIGAPIGGYCWIVEPDNPQQLAPIGCVGEVVIQSPTLLRDYLSDPTKTGAVIVSDLPAWAPRRSESRWNRLYKTGDLCYYNSKGQIIFASRKDTQVKIRGLRVELSEVEHHLYKSLEGAKQAVVDLVHTDSGPKLACFFCDKLDTRINPDARASEIFKPLSGDVQAHVTAAAGKLNVTLPRYMVPTLYIPCRYMPSITSTKIDRKKLRLLVATLDAEQLLNYSLHDTSQRAPETEIEVELQTIWSKLLSLKQEAIGRDDSFLHLGGDSIKVIQLIKVAREHGISLTVRDVFDDPRLCAVASAARLLDVNETHQDAVPSPFSLLSDDLNEATLMKALKTQYGLSGQVELEDAFPCTKLQEGLITIAEKQPGSYIAKNIYRLPQNMDIARFMAAWETTVKLCANLRTRIIRADGAAIQIIVKENCQWEAVSDLSSYKASTKDALMGYGSRLSRYAITKERDGSRLFVFDCHHSIFDEWTLPLIVGTLTSAYQGVALPRLHSYSSFVKYVTDLDHHAASSYWSAYLVESSKATFPPSRDSVQPSSGTSTTKSRTKVFQRIIQIPSSASSSASVTKASLLRGAWGLVLARYCDLDDVCFGATVSGRQANISGIDEMPGLVIATVPVRVRLNQQQSVEKYLRGIQSDASKMVAYEQFGLQNISKVSPAAREACDFNSLLVIQPVGHITSTASEGDAVLLQPGPDHAHAEELVQGYFSYSLVVQCHLLKDSIRLAFIYDTEVLPTQRLEALSHHVDHVIQQLTTNTSAKLGSISASSPWDMERFVAANSKVNDVVEDCVHNLFEAQVKQRPDATAIMGWDRSFTYAELNQAADRLAHHLVKNHNVQVGDLIPVCFDKSAWYTVAILAVNKAGGAWVPLDPSHPSQRHQQIVDKVKPRLMLASTSTTELCRKILPDVISVDEALNMRLASDQQLRVTTAPAVKVTPRTAAYVLLTSGSTGVPKALVMEHSAVCTSQVAIYERLNLSPSTRMLQFSAHVFHVSVGEIFATLLSGGVVCVPSDDTKLNDLSSFIRKMDVNSAVFTPSFVRTLNPDHIPELDILIVVGEAVSRDVLEKWFGRAKHFINAWGPAEDCVFSSFHEWTSIDESPLTIGHPIGSYGWIVDPKDPSRLAPTGALGEIVLQGPTLFREYLNDAEQTEKSIMTSLPEWAPRRQEAYWDRLYKTGDLGRYSPDGTIEFVSQKDTQIKIRGLRVELGEVEYHVQAAVTTARQVVVDVHKSDAGSSLIAYLCFSDARELSSQESLPNPFLPLEKERQEQLSTAMSDVASKLPRYMIPSRFIPCSYMPVVSSAKVDRKALRWLTAELDDATLTGYSLSDSSKRAPSTPHERKLQGVWAQTLSRDPESIYRDDSFFDLGGDSIMAIQAVSFARDSGILIRVQDIFHDPRLCAVAERATAIDAGETDESDVEPFSLLSDQLQVLTRGSEVKSQCGLSSDLTIEDAFPCTSFQEGLLTLSVKQPGSYIAKYIYRLPDNVSLSRFQTAWQETVMACSNLRTRIVLLNNTSVQVVIKDDVHWELANQSTSLKAAMQAMGTKKMTYGSRLCRYSLVSDASGSKYFIWAIHHSMFDGWTIRLVMTALHQAYAGQAVTHLERYSGFIQYLQRVDQAAAGNYWTNQLQNAKRARFPPPLKAAVTNRKPAETKEATRNVIATIDVPSTTNPAITKATFVRAAWAIVLSRYCNSTDVCFGTSISGRQAPVRGILEMPGPAIATVPVRIRLDRNQAALEYLQSVQTQASEMVPYEQFGLQNISKLGADAKDACDFTSLLVIQPRQHLDQVGGSDGSSNGAAPPLLTLVDEENGDAPGQMLDNYYSYPLIVQGHLGSDSITLTLTYNIKVLSESTMKAVSEQLSHVIKHLIIKAGN